jgi:hypothetical protein
MSIKEKVEGWTEKKLTAILYGKGHYKGVEVISKDDASHIARRSISFWQKIRPYLYGLSFGIIIFIFFPKVTLLSQEKIQTILLFSIYMILFIRLPKTPKSI